MTRRKVFIAFAAAVMILVLTAALFVACDQTKTYTVTFKDGETVVKTASVKDGATIADADLPADPTKDSAVFEGWFDGDKAFDKTAAITGDVTYTAKWTSLFTVTFKDGDTVIATATVKDGEKIAASDIPANLADTQDSAFEGWFNGDSAFDKDAAITASVTYNAKWTGLFNVTFMNGDTQVKSVKVKDGAVISAEDVPGALADTDFAFLGWFVGDVAYDSSAAVTSNIVVNAKFSTFFKSYIGTWHGATSDWDPIAYTVVVDANSISVTIGNAAAQVATGVAVDADGSVMFKLGETEYMLYQDYDGSLKIFESSDVKLSKELAGRVHVSSSDIVGTYTTEGGHTIVINETFAKVDGVLGTGFYYNASSGYSWSIGDNYSSLAYDSSAQAWIYKEGTSSAADKLIVPELVAIDIPAEFIGNWYGTFESFGSTSYFLVKVTADGVFAYTPGSGFAKVGVATEYKDGKLTVVGLDETITASIADGKLAYKSDAAYGADYQLEKGTVVVFENNYSVFYVAKLGADNKIDQSTFALEDPQMKAGYTFKGWAGDLDGAEFDEDATFADSAVFVGSSEKTGYVVTFKKTSSDNDPVIAVVEMTNGKLAADQIPAALTYEDGSVFTGWFTSAGVKATADLAITADTTFIAKSVKESDYAGYWINTTSGKEALAVIADGKVSFEKLARNVAYTYEDGCLKFTVKDRYSIPYNYVITKTNIGITITESYYDRDAQENVDNIYQLTAATATTTTKRYAGTYQCSKSEIITVLENGVVTKVDGAATTYGYISGSASSIKITYKTESSSSVTTKTGKYDAKSLVLGGKIYVKNPSSFASYYNSDNGTFYAYAREGKATIYTYNGTDYATVDGELAVGNIVTVTYGDKSFVAKITSATEYDVAGAEKGAYTAEGKDALTLNGFGDATLGEKSYKYSINAKNVVVLTGETTLGVTLDSKAKTYAEVASDGFVHTYIDASNEKYTMAFDGFGGATLTYSSYSTSVYSGTYTLGTGTVTVEKANYSYNKTYTIEESGNVLASTDSKTTLAVKGYVVEKRLNEMNGFWQSADKAHSIEIIVKSEKKIFIKIDQSSVYFADGINYNGTKIMFRDDNSKDYCIDRTATGISMSDIAYSSATQTFDVDTTKIVGQWELFGDVYYVKCVFNADGKVDVARMSAFGTTKDTVAYTSEANAYTFTFKKTKYTCTLKADGSLDVSTLGTARKIADPEVSGGTPEEPANAFVGTWSGKIGVASWTIVINSDGTFTANGTTYHYTVDSETKASSVEADGSDKLFTFELRGDKLRVDRYDSDAYETFTGDLTKQA